MSRIGKKPIPVPPGVKVEIKDDVVSVSSSDGKKKLSQAVRFVKARLENGTVIVDRVDDSRSARGCHGLYRTLIANMIDGVTKGFSQTLEIEGAGYKAELQGKNLVLTVGYTLPRVFPVPAGIDITVPGPTQVVIQGIDKHLVGQTAAVIYGLRPADPYRGKGIRYKGQRVITKVAKGKGK